MYWIEICTDGSYVIDDQQYSLCSDGIEQTESFERERSGNHWAKTTIPFEIETEHGLFVWEVEIIEYLERGVASLLGYRIIKYPDHVLLKEDVMFRMQDGWAFLEAPTLDLKPRMSKMRLA